MFFYYKDSDFDDVARYKKEMEQRQAYEPIDPRFQRRQDFNAEVIQQQNYAKPEVETKKNLSFIDAAKAQYKKLMEEIQAEEQKAELKKKQKKSANTKNIQTNNQIKGVYTQENEVNSPRDRFGREIAGKKEESNPIIDILSKLLPLLVILGLYLFSMLSK